jgi:hypothetical protein
MLELDKLTGWLSHSLTESSDKKYAHRLLKENSTQRDQIIHELKNVVERAHEDTKRHLRKVVDINLDPLGIKAKDPADGYPEKLNIETLKGYFGEIFAGIVAEIFPHFGKSGWKVPAFPFRFHQTAFDELERWRQKAVAVPRITVGRTGDDSLAFLRDEDGRIICSLVCEAKCTKNHRREIIYEAHKEVSEPLSKPLEISRLVEILRDYDDPISKQWVEALTILYHSDVESEYERYDLVSYICGQFPKMEPTWISTNNPDRNYTAGRKLEAVEVHLHDVELLVRTVYSVKER